jgi:hypothetical protein
MAKGHHSGGGHDGFHHASVERGADIANYPDRVGPCALPSQSQDGAAL